MNTFHWLTILILYSVTPISAQYHYILDDFKATKDKQRVIIQWTIKKGNTCTGVGILRSTDEQQYEVIGEIKEVCGSFDAPASYYFIDENPVKNKTNFYLLELGFSGKTIAPVHVEIIDFGDKSSKVIPNPSNGACRVVFENPNNQKYMLRLYDISGKYVHSQYTREDYFIISLESNSENAILPNTLHASQYFYIIHDDQNQNIGEGIIMVSRN